MESKENHPNRSNFHSHAEKLYSPRAAAKAIGVSESSLKRWVDAGKITAVKTSGGHRRLQRSAILEFLRSRTKYAIHEPTVIGLPVFENTSIASSADAAGQLYEYLIKAAEEDCRRLLLYMFVNGWKLEEMFDQVISPVFVRIGQEYQAGTLEIYQERRACEVCLNVVREIRSMLVGPETNAPTAIGGSVENDHYAMPTYAVEVTLGSNGWNAKSLGSNLPFHTLLAAVKNEEPNLFWLSVSHIKDQETFANQLNEFSTQLPESTRLLIGGYAISAELRANLKNVTCCDNLSQLVASTKHLVPAQV